MEEGQGSDPGPQLAWETQGGGERAVWAPIADSSFLRSVCFPLSRTVPWPAPRLLPKQMKAPTALP